MKNIFYCSNTQQDLFPANTRSSFESFIDINDLDYLANDNIEAGVKSITFNNKRGENQLIDEILVLRSNVTRPIIRNGGYDRIIAQFNASSRNRDVTHIDFKNPSFFETTKESLASAWFEIINIDTESPPNFTIASPTFIQLIVRKITPMMRKPVNVFLDSADESSKILYPENNNVEFTVKLPDILEFKNNWHVTLKSLHIPNMLFNIYENSCLWQFDDTKGRLEKNWIQSLGAIQEGCYSTPLDLVNKIQSDWDFNQNVPLVISLKEGKVKIMLKHDNFISKRRIIQLYLSPKLANILGYNISESNGHFLRFDKNSYYLASYNMNLFLLTPKNIIVSCNIIDETMFCGQSVQLLRLLTNHLDHSSNILNFEFFSNEYVSLKTKSFENITFRLSDVSGQQLKCGSSSPTRLQLKFINI